jgi:hypothetical protein
MSRSVRDRIAPEKLPNLFDQNKGYYDKIKKAYHRMSYDIGRKSEHEEISTEHIPESRQRPVLGAGAVERMMIGKE